MIMKKEEMKITELYDLTHTLASDYLKQFTYPWEALAGLSDFIIELGNSLDPAEYEKRGENIWVHKTAKVFDSAYLHGPVIVGKDAEVRHCVHGDHAQGNVDGPARAVSERGRDPRESRSAAEIL